MAEASSGGAAMSAGAEFQSRVAAWFAVRVLAETAAAPLYDLPADAYAAAIRLETSAPTDDLAVTWSNGSTAYVQCKRGLKATNAPNSDFAKVIAQFVSHYYTAKQTIGSGIPRLDPLRDRLVLGVDSTSSTSIRDDLPSFLERLRGLPATEKLSSLPLPKHHREMRSKMLRHINTAWQSVARKAPTEDELRALCSIIRIHTFAIDAGQDGELAARELLRQALVETHQDMIAWSSLIAGALRMAATRSGADRPVLLTMLARARIAVRAPRSFASDIERLRSYSSRTLNALSDLSRINEGGISIRLVRPVVDRLLEAAENGSLLITGEPGAGKSGTLHDAAERWHASGHDVVVLAVDRMEAGSDAAFSNEVRLDHALSEVLEAWSGTRPGLLIIDALDAARSSTAAQFLRDVIRRQIRIGSRWHVVASIRRYDLRHSAELPELFSGEPIADFQENEFRKIRHIHVPVLTYDELEDIASNVPELDVVLSRATHDLKELLRVPFNLRLMAGLVGAGVPIQELTPIRTRLDLLDQYWRKRVLGEGDERRDAREAVLRRTVEAMVDIDRMRIPRSQIASSTDSIALSELLSRGVLAEWQPRSDAVPEQYVIVFGHNVLFDYALARLFFRGDSVEQLVARIAGRPDRSLIFRPSLEIHFDYLWSEQGRARSRFWELTFALTGANNVPEIAKLVGPAMIAERASSASDLLPIVEALATSSENEPAIRALQHVVSTIAAADDVTHAIAGPTAGPWCAVLANVSRNLTRVSAFAIRPLLFLAGQNVLALTPEQRSQLGIAARATLRVVETLDDQAAASLAPAAIQAVMRTWSTNKDESAELIRAHIDRNHLSERGHQELFWITNEIGRIVREAPEIVAEIYRAVFGYVETRDDQVPLSDSQILPLTQSRKQAFDSSKYRLAEVFGRFLDTSPIEAARALIEVIDRYVAGKRRGGSTAPEEQTFKFGTHLARFMPDYSFIWDSGNLYRNDPPVKMLNSFEEHLAKTIPANAGAIDEILAAVAANNRAAVIWRRLLRAGSQHPTTIGIKLGELLEAKPILSSGETTREAAALIRSTYDLLSEAQRGRIEAALLFIANSKTSVAQRGQALLGCIPPDLVTTQEARAQIEQWMSSGGAPPVERAIRTEVTWSNVTTRDFLDDLGVPQDKAHEEFVALEEPLEEFSRRFLNERPSAADVNLIIIHARALHEALRNAQQLGIHPEAEEHGWAVLAAACADVARATDVRHDSDQAKFVIERLLEARSRSTPVFDAATEDRFNETQSWGSPSARIEAAEGLCDLVIHWKRVESPLVSAAIEQLSKDSVSAVRYQVAVRVGNLARKLPDIAWRIAHSLAFTEQNRGVVSAYVSSSLVQLLFADKEKAKPHLFEIIGRINGGLGAEDIRAKAWEIVAGLYVWQGDATCAVAIKALARNPRADVHSLQQVLPSLRDLLTHGTADPADPTADLMRARGFELFSLALEAAQSTFRAALLASKLAAPEAKEQFQLIHTIALELYFASGAGNEHGESPNQAAMQKRFYTEASAMFQQLADLGLTPVTQHVVKTLAFLVPVDPAAIFKQVSFAVIRAENQGYQYEQLAANEVVGIVERYFADYRHIFVGDAECRAALVQLLDVFVRAGWPAARRLVYRLSEVVE